MSHYAELPLPSSIGAKGPRRARHAPARIVVAEDDDRMRCLVGEVLRREGYAVREVRDGGRLLVALTTDPDYSYDETDLIISDIRMPVCTGLQIVQVLRETHCAIPVILMTAFSDRSVREAASRLGALILDKPFDLRDLCTTVAELLDGPRMH